MNNIYVQWVFDNPLGVAGASLVTAGVIAAIVVAFRERRASFSAYFEHRRQLRIQRGLLMGKKKAQDRKAFVKQVLADAITNGVEEAWFKGKLTREEANDLYRMVGKTHGIPDLIPTMDQAQLKSAIKGRRSRGAPAVAQEDPKWGAPPSVNPDPNYNVIDAKKSFGAKALKLLKTA